jgi:hypothetical protein
MPDMFPVCPGCGRILEPVTVINPFTKEERVMAPWVPCLDCRKKAEEAKAPPPAMERARGKKRQKTSKEPHKYFDKYFQ